MTMWSSCSLDRIHTSMRAFFGLQRLAHRHIDQSNLWSSICRYSNTMLAACLTLLVVLWVTRADVRLFGLWLDSRYMNRRDTGPNSTDRKVTTSNRLFWRRIWYTSDNRTAYCHTEYKTLDEQSSWRGRWSVIVFFYVSLSFFKMIWSPFGCVTMILTRYPDRFKRATRLSLCVACRMGMCSRSFRFGIIATTV